MPHFRLSIVLSLTLALGSVASAREIHVSTTGRAGSAGTQAEPLANLAEAVNLARAGDVIRIASGTYKHDRKITLTHSGMDGRPIRIEQAGDARPILDFSAQPVGDDQFAIELKADRWDISGIEVIGAGDTGIFITGHHNIIRRCVARENKDTGIEIGAPGSHNLVVDCDSYRNVDFATFGENADGFAAKLEVGEGNIFRNCRAWENADDGFDLYQTTKAIRIEYSLAMRNGVNVWQMQGFRGNGSGFKLGGNYTAAPHVAIGCVAIDQPSRGFHQNHNTGPLLVEDCIAIRCRTGYEFNEAPKEGRHILRRNVAFSSGLRIVDGTLLEDNRWQAERPPVTQPAAAAP